MRHPPIRYTPVRYTPMRHPPIRCTFVGCMPVRYVLILENGFVVLARSLALILLSQWPTAAQSCSDFSRTDLSELAALSQGWRVKWGGIGIRPQLWSGIRDQS